MLGMHSRWLAALWLVTACSSTTSTTTTPGPGDAESDSRPVTTRDGGEDAESDSDANVVDVCAMPKGTPTENRSDDCIVLGACPCSDAGAYRCAVFGPPTISVGDTAQQLKGCTGFGDVTCCPAACVRAKRLDSKCAAMRPDAWDCPIGAKRPETTGDCETKTDGDGTRETVCCSN